MAQAEKACREILNQSDILCYQVITQAILPLSESGEAETSYLNLNCYAGTAIQGQKKIAKNKIRFVMIDLYSPASSKPQKDLLTSTLN